MITKYDVAIKNLINSKQFYANVLLNSIIQFTDSDKIVPTAGVCYTKKGIKFLFNNNFLNRLTVDEVEGVIEHECNHILFSHIFKTEKLNKADHRLWNVAQDCVINQYIDEHKLPNPCITPEMIEEKIGKPILRLQTSGYYYNILTENKDKFPTEDSLDVHFDSLDELTEDEKEILIQDVVSKAEKQAKNSGAGSLSLDVQNLIDKILSNKVSFKQIIKNLVGKSVSSSRTLTKKRLNRRYGNRVPGNKKKRTVNIAVITDSSGSVDDSSYSKFLSEIENGRKSIEGIIYHIQADSEVKDIKVYRRGEKIKFERNGYGGTMYQPAITKAVELGVDAIIYCGDGDSADTPVDPGLPFTWVLVGNSRPPADFGNVIYLDTI